MACEVSTLKISCVLLCRRRGQNGVNRLLCLAFELRFINFTAIAYTYKHKHTKLLAQRQQRNSNQSSSCQTKSHASCSKRTHATKRTRICMCNRVPKFVISMNWLVSNRFVVLRYAKVSTYFLSRAILEHICASLNIQHLEFRNTLDYPNMHACHFSLLLSFLLRDALTQSHE